VPEYLLRFVAFVLTRTVYRFKVRGDEHIPTEGAAILVCNHVSFVDAVLLMAASPRPIRFIMDHRIFATPVLGWLFRLGKAIPIAPQKEDPEGLRARLRAGARRCWTKATCCASSPRAASRATAAWASSRAA
jgi:1-acyl-sn-glycerol-3-phosphate acyltransferase